MRTRGIVVGSQVQIGNHFSFNGGLNSSDVIKWLLYWDKIAYAGINGLSGNHPDDFQLLESEGVFFTENILVNSIELNNLPPPDPSITMMGIAGNHMPYYLSAARVALSNKLSKLDEIWTVGQSGGEMLILPPSPSKIDLIDIQLVNKMPVPLSDVPFNELLEFRARYRDELVRLRFALDAFREKVLNSVDEKRTLDAALYEIAKSLEDIDNAMTGKGIRHIKESISLYTNNPAIGFWGCLGGISTAALGVPIELAGAASLAIPTVCKFMSRCIDASNYVPNLDNDFAYAFQVKKLARHD
jgi:hypothetical protein